MTSIAEPRHMIERVCRRMKATGSDVMNSEGCRAAKLLTLVDAVDAPPGTPVLVTSKEDISASS